MSVHNAADLKLMQSMPLKHKIQMTEDRIRGWYNTWTKFEIFDQETGKTRFETIAVYDFEKPKLKKSEYIVESEPGQVYVSFSGGKDSTVLKHIVDRMYYDVPSVFVNTGLEYPEIQKFAMSQKNVITVRPEMRFDQVVKEYGYPVISKTISKKVGTVSRNGKECKTFCFFEGNATTKSGSPSKFNCKKWAFLCDAPFKIDYFCCEIMKKKPFRAYEELTGRKPIAAVMACESETRAAAWMKTGCNAFEGTHQISNPMAFWTEQDVLHYLKEKEVPYCSLYGDIQIKQEKEFADQMNVIDFLGCYDPDDILENTGCSRTGCIFCMYGCHLEHEPNRFQRLKETHPMQYNYCINGGEIVDGKWQPNKEGLGLGYVLDYIGVKYD